MLKIDAKRHLAKTVSWRLIGTIDTIILSWIISGDPFIGLSIGGAEVITKMSLYYFHERVWYRVKWGIQRPRKTNDHIEWHPERHDSNTIERQVAFLQDESNNWIKRAKITQCVAAPEHFTVHLSYYDKTTRERLNDVSFHNTKQEVEDAYKIKINDYE